MFAKQTVVSASLVAVWLGAAVTARADPERPATGTFEVGAGFSPYEGFIARARVEQSSLFGSGHMLALEARVSAQRQDLSLAYETADLGGGLTLQAEVFKRRRVLPGFVREGTGAGLSLQQKFGENLRAFVGVRYESVTQPITTTLATVRAGIIYESRRTSFGMIYELSDERLGSKYTFDRMEMWAEHHRPIGPLTLHLSASFTQLMGNVPQSERLFIDGVTDIRGYVPTDFWTQGTTKFATRAELEAPLVKRIGLSAVGFFDMGGVLDGDANDMGRSVGVGLRWRSPIGTLSFDWAVPLDGGAPRFLFGLGGDW